MTKTQITVPDELYAKAKAIARAKEWSLAEVFRRGLEHMASMHVTDKENSEWELPIIQCDGSGLTQSDDLLRAIAEERDESALRKIGG